jgi:NAD(P)-dependent dehydrogenase (short-subunit alcohol dehydrogenase family)
MEVSMDGQPKALVTGASSGIGRATAIEFARRGYRVFAAARREAALAELAAATPNIVAVAIDITDSESVRRGWAKIQADTGGSGVDVLVNNAGFALTGPIETLTAERIERQFGTNVFGLVTLTRTVLPTMRARGSGRIINLSSVVGRVTFPGMGAYGATKYAVEAISDALRLEVAPFGIDVVLIEPSFVATEIGASLDALDAAPSSADDAYRELVEQGQRYVTKQVANGIPAEQVAIAIVDAATTRKPRPRYLVPGSARPLVAFLTTLPDRVADRVKLRAIGAR